MLGSGPFNILYPVIVLMTGYIDLIRIGDTRTDFLKAVRAGRTPLS